MKFYILSDFMQEQNVDLRCPNQSTLFYAMVPLRANGDKAFSNIFPIYSYRPFEILLPSNGLLRGHM